MGSRGEEGRGRGELSTSEEDNAEQLVKKKRVRRKKKGRKKESGSEQEQGKEGSGQAENEAAAAPEKEEKETNGDKEEKKEDEERKERPERPKEASGSRRFSVSPRSRKGSNLRSQSPEKGKGAGEVEGRSNGPVNGPGGASTGRRMSKFEMFDQLRKHGLVDPNEDKVDLMETIMAQAKASMSMLKVKEHLQQVEDDDEDDEDIEDVEGSGLTSASTTRGGKGGGGPKTVPGLHVGETAAQLPVIPPQPSPAKEERGAGRGTRGKRARGGKVVGRGRGRGDLAKPKKDETKEVAAAVAPTAVKAEEERVSTIEFKLPQTTAEFERQLASMKHIPPAVVPPASRQRIPATLRLPPTNPNAALPPIVVHGGGPPPAKHQFSSSYDKWADQNFYADFKFQFIPMPQPRDALPCKCRLV